MQRKFMGAALLLLLLLAGCGSKGSDNVSIGDEELVKYKKVSVDNYSVGNDDIRTISLRNDGSLEYVAIGDDGQVIASKVTGENQESSREICKANEQFINCFWYDSGKVLLTATEEFVFFYVLEDNLSDKKISVLRSDINDEIPIYFCGKDKDEYLCITQFSIYSIDNSGKVDSSNQFTDISFRKAASLFDGSICLLCVDSNGALQLTCLDGKELVPGKRVQLDFYLSHIIENDGKCLISDGSRIWAYNRLSNRISEYCNLDGFYLKSECIRDISFAEESMVIAYYDKLNAPQSVRVINFEVEDEENAADNSVKSRIDSEGRKVIYVYSPNGAYAAKAIFGEALTNFAIDSTDYAVEIIEANDNIDVAIAPNVSPDIICDVTPSIISKYARVNYLEDLWPYIEASNVLEKDDFNSVIKKLYETDGHLYGITNEISIKGIRISREDDNGETAWTRDKLIEWLERHPDVSPQFGSYNGYKARSLFTWGLLHDYVDFDSKKADFLNDEFMNTIERIRNISFAGGIEDEGLSLSDAEDLDKLSKHPYVVVATLSNISQMAQEEALLGKKIDFIGYPSNNSVPCAILYPISNVAITVESENKEGAFNFIEYWLCEQKKTLEIYKENPEITPKPGGVFSSINSLFEDGIRAGLGQGSVWVSDQNSIGKTLTYDITEEYIEKAQNLLSSARVETFDEQMIEMIMVEELYSYWEGTKNLFETTEAIQRRVQLYLDERN